MSVQNSQSKRRKKNELCINMQFQTRSPNDSTRLSGRSDVKSKAQQFLISAVCECDPEYFLQKTDLSWSLSVHIACLVPNIAYSSTSTVLHAKDTLRIWCMCDRALYMKMTRGTNLIQQLWFIIINISTCFGHLYVHLQEYRLYVTAYGVQH